MRRTAGIAAACAVVLLGLLIAVVAGGLGAGSVDADTVQSAHHAVLRDHWLLRSARDTTNLGAPVVVDAIAVVAAIVCWLLGRRRDGLLVVAVRIATWLLTDGLKGLVDRPRPAVAVPLGHWSGSSFPSGHASGAASVYLTLAVVAAAVCRSRPARVGLAAGAGLICLLVAVSRVLLGAHYPSDVAAGLALGGLVLTLCWATAQQGRSGYPRVPQTTHARHRQKR